MNNTAKFTLTLEEKVAHYTEIYYHAYVAMTECEIWYDKYDEIKYNFEKACKDLKEICISHEHFLYVTNIECHDRYWSKK